LHSHAVAGYGLQFGHFNIFHNCTSLPTYLLNLLNRKIIRLSRFHLLSLIPNDESFRRANQCARESVSIGDRQRNDTSSKQNIHLFGDATTFVAFPTFLNSNQKNRPMRLTSWIDGFRTRLLSSRRIRADKRRARSVPRRSEKLEDRTLLTVSAFFQSGELTVLSDDADSILLQEDPTRPGFVEVIANGTKLLQSTSYDAALITSIVIEGGGGDNSIDLSNVTAALFSNPDGLTIRVDGGNGNDLIIGSDDFADELNGGDGNDTIVGAGGNDVIDAGDGDDDIDGGQGNDTIDRKSVV
jgi:hypothetical protein